MRRDCLVIRFASEIKFAGLNVASRIHDKWVVGVEDRRAAGLRCADDDRLYLCQPFDRAYAVEIEMVAADIGEDADVVALAREPAKQYSAASSFDDCDVDGWVVYGSPGAGWARVIPT